MFKTLVGAFKNKDIRKKIIYTLLILVVVRVGSLLPIPGVDTNYFRSEERRVGKECRSRWSPYH